MYRHIIRPILFLVDAETIHKVVFNLLKCITFLPGGKSLLRSLFSFEDPRLRRSVLGLNFKNPVGLAAGFDKDAKHLTELDCLGFGFIEIGTLTPKPQPGNEKPRLLRLPEDQALINRMGFNNDGVLDAVERLRKKGSILVGGNIGKNKITPNEKADADYAYSFEALFDYVDYFVVNVSSPNTPGLRALQDKEPLKQLLTSVMSLRSEKPVKKPVLLKIAPDLTTEQLDDVIEILKATGLDGVIATNTTIARAGLKTNAEKLARIGNGGLSGAPLASRSNEVIRYLRKNLGPDFPIVGVGGIMSTRDALAKLEAGADLVQIYTGFIYEGPGFVKRINKEIVKTLG